MGGGRERGQAGHSTGVGTHCQSSGQTQNIPRIFLVQYQLGK